MRALRVLGMTGKRSLRPFGMTKYKGGVNSPPLWLANTVQCFEIPRLTPRDALNRGDTPSLRHLELKGDAVSYCPGIIGIFIRCKLVGFARPEVATLYEVSKAFVNIVGYLCINFPTKFL